MKNKYHHHHKFKPLLELYPIELKVDSDLESKSLNNFTTEKSVNAKSCKINTCALPYTSCEPLSVISSKMENPEIGFTDTTLSATDSPRRSDGNESLNTNTLVLNTQESLLQSQTKSCGDGLDELVDVRVCDTCGDSGREALLALCSTCSDGAEHIYCMRNKMDSVPEKGWMCEECVGMQELKGLTEVVAEKAGSALRASRLAELIQPSPRKSSVVQQVGEPSTKLSRKAFSLPVKRYTKKRKYEEGIHPLKSCTSPRKRIDKGKRAFEPAYSSGHKLLKSEEQFCKGSLSKSKTDSISELNTKVQQLSDGTLQMIDTAKESADSKLENHFPNKKLFKSSSFTGPDSSDMPNPQVSYMKSKGLKCGDKIDLSKNVYVPEKKTMVSLSLTRSCSMKVRPSTTKMISKTAKAVPFLDKDFQIGENIKVDKSSLLAQKGKKHANLLTRSVEEKSSSESVKPAPTLVPAKLAPSVSSVVPAAECIWKGGFKFEKSAQLPNYCNRVQAHTSICTSSDVHEVVSKFGPKLLLKEVPRSETWPTYFQGNCPTEQDISLYFFAEDLQSYGSYKKLIDGMIGKDLVLEGSFDGIQLLVLPSSLLPVTSQRWNSLFYLWGVCRGRKVDDLSPHFPSLNVAYGSANKSVSTMEGGSFSASQTSHNSIQGPPELVYPLIMHSSDLTMSNDQICGRGTFTNKCFGAQEETDTKPDIIQSVHDVTKETFVSGALHTDDVLKGIQTDNQDIICASKTAIFPFGQSDGENMLSLAINSGVSGFYSAGSCKDLSSPRVYNPASEFCYRRDIPSRSSISIDSGPSGSSDGYAKSYEAHKEQSEKPPSSRALSLDLCLGFSSQPEEEVGLDLVLGFPDKYQPERYTESRNRSDVNTSLFLSLGMPC